MSTLELFRTLLLSVLLGLLVGLQRERSKSPLAGFRTFPLVTMLGTLCALFAREYDMPWLLPVGFLGLIVLAIVGSLPMVGDQEAGGGVTTEVALFVMFTVGALVMYGPWTIAVVTTGGVAFLLYLKPQLHGFAERLGDDDFHAIMQFVLITFIILPVIPNEEYDPFAGLDRWFPQANLPSAAVLNPFEIWLIVVLVVGISLAGYVVSKLFGRRASTLLGGILGGVVSSTATTVSYARSTARNPEAVGLSTAVITIASAVTFVRIIVEVAIAGGTFIQQAIGPLSALLGLAVAVSVAAWLMQPGGESQMPPQKNPSELRYALIFAATYAIVLLAVAVGQHYLSYGGLYIVAAISGLTNVDAITLSTARLVQAGRLDVETGWRAVIIGSLSNLIFKTGIVAVLGSRPLFWRTAGYLGLMVAGGLLIVWFWP